MVWPMPFLTLAYFVIVNLLIIGLDSIFLFGITKTGNLYFTSDFNSSKPVVFNFAFNSIAWTIGIELLFYLIAPFIVRRHIIYPILILLASLLLRILLAGYGYEGAPWNYMFFPTQLMFFMGGVLAYKLYKKIQHIHISRALLITMYVVLLAVLLLYYQFFAETYLKQAVLFLTVALLIPASFILTKKSKADRVLGNLSYPIYISQALIIKFVAIKSFPKFISPGFTALVVVIAFSIVLDYVVTRPIEKYRQKRVSLNKARSSFNAVS